MSVLRAPLYTEGVFSSVMGGNDGGDEGWIGKDWWDKGLLDDSDKGWRIEEEEEDDSLVDRFTKS